MNYIDENIAEIRNEFKMLKYWVHLNAADQSLPGNYWLNAIREFYNFVECGRMEDIPNSDVATHPFLTSVWQDSINLGAKFINADRTEVTNMYRPAIAANLLLYNTLEWEKGDNVVINNLSYPAIPYILQDISRRYGVELRMVNHVNGEILMDDLAKKIDKKTKLVAIDRTAAFSGFTFDVKAVCDLAHQHGALVLDDAMQALGAINIDVKHDDVDILISGAYKWQCGPEGAGIFYMKKDLIERFDPKFRNYVWSNFSGPIPFGFQDHDNIKHWQHPPVNNANKFSQDITIGSSLFGWIATLKFYQKMGMHNVEEKVRTLGTYAVERLQDIGCKVTSPLDPKKRHGLITYTTGDYKKDVEFFERCACPGRCMKPIKISLRALGGIGNLRLCTHFYNTKEDIDYFVELQKSLL